LLLKTNLLSFVHEWNYYSFFGNNKGDFIMAKGRRKASKKGSAKQSAAFKKKLHVAQAKHKKAAATVRSVVAASKKKIRAAKAAAKKAHSAFKKLAGGKRKKSRMKK
jgi:hypothetical protein